MTIYHLLLNRLTLFMIHFSVCSVSSVATKNPVILSNCLLRALGSLWLKIFQSKITNYAKRTQFFKKSNVYNRNFNNELQRKMDNGHLVKTNPNEPNSNPNKANSKPKQPPSKPKQTQSNPILPRRPVRRSPPMDEVGSLLAKTVQSNCFSGKL
jgi:hypothetical protein